MAGTKNLSFFEFLRDVLIPRVIYINCDQLLATVFDLRVQNWSQYSLRMAGVGLALRIT